MIPGDKLDSLYACFCIGFYKKALMRENIQSTQKNINKGIVERFSIPVPSIDDQQRITSLLSIIISYKEKTQLVIDALKELKKSMMQHLFTYGPVPIDGADSVELKETEIGSIPVYWVLVTIGDIAKITPENYNPIKKNLNSNFS